MSVIITDDGRFVIWTGEDGNPASSTVGMCVVTARRALSAEEHAEWGRLVGRLNMDVSPVTPRGNEESYGDAGRAYDTWQKSIPRHKPLRAE